MRQKLSAHVWSFFRLIRQQIDGGKFAKPKIIRKRIGKIRRDRSCMDWLAAPSFYAPQLYRQVLLRRVLAMGIMSVCLPVRLSVTTRWYTKPRWDRYSGSSPYHSLESLVSNEVIWCRWVRRFPSNEGIKEGYSPPLRNRYFTTIGSSSVKTVAERHRLAAYHSKHCRRAFQWYQHRWPWMTLNPQNRGFWWIFLAILGCNTHFKTELRRNHSR